MKSDVSIVRIYLSETARTEGDVFIHRYIQNDEKEKTRIRTEVKEDSETAIVVFTDIEIESAFSVICDFVRCK